MNYLWMKSPVRDGQTNYCYSNIVLVFGLFRKVRIKNNCNMSEYHYKEYHSENIESNISAERSDVLTHTRWFRAE